MDIFSYSPYLLRDLGENRHQKWARNAVELLSFAKTGAVMAVVYLRT